MSLFTYKRVHVVIRDPVDRTKRHDFLSPIFQGSEAERTQILRAFEAQITERMGGRPEPRDILVEETIETQFPEPEPETPMKPHQKTAVVDLDGTLSQYDHWRGEEHFGPPVKNAVNALKELKEWGWRIVVWTTRGNEILVKAWLLANALPFDAINSSEHNPPGCSGKPIAEVYFDDRDCHVVGQVYDWNKAMKRVRKLYQPSPRTVEIDDAAAWASWL